MTKFVLGEQVRRPITRKPEIILDVHKRGSEYFYETDLGNKYSENLILKYNSDSDVKIFDEVEDLTDIIKENGWLNVQVNYDEFVKKMDITIKTYKKNKRINKIKKFFGIK